MTFVGRTHLILVQCIALAFLSLLPEKVLSRPHEDTPPALEEQKPSANASQIPKDQLVISQPEFQDRESESEEEPRIHYQYTSSASPRIGGYLDNNLFKEKKSALYSFGATYLLPRNRSPQLEVGADVLSNSSGHIHASRRMIWAEREAFRPFYKLGLSHRIQADYKLASLVRVKNYYLQTSIGLEDLIRRPMSVRIEVQFEFNLSNQFLSLFFGYSWGW